MGPIYGSQPIGLLYFIGPLDLGGSAKVAPITTKLFVIFLKISK
jgi:hypothetical protein